MSAIQEFDLIGRYVFLKKYGYRKAVSYLLVHNGREYDTKAIIGVAFGYQYNKTPLTNNEFSGGKATVEKALIRMGFKVEYKKVISNFLYKKSCKISKDNSFKKTIHLKKQFVE